MKTKTEREVKTEIGSIYEINPEALEAARQAATKAFVQWRETEVTGETTGFKQDRDFPHCFRLKEVEKYGKKYCYFTGSGREAIALALKSLETDRPELRKSCLLPAYMCDSVFFPFLRAGWKLNFYHLEEDLTVNLEKLCCQLQESKPGLLFIHPYYGVDTWKQLRPWFPQWQAQGICIMEDVTQSYYLETAGQEADYVVGSLRKWYAIPDGGFLASHKPLPERELADHQAFWQARLEILLKKWEYLHKEASREEKQAIKEEYLDKNRKLEEELDDYAEISSLSEVSAWLLGQIKEEECCRKRRENSQFIYQKLQDWGQADCHPLLLLDSHTAPLYLPVYAQNRDELQSFLQKRNVFAPVLWLIGEENQSCLTQTEQNIYQHMLALPVDQRYGKKEMEDMAGVLEEYLLGRKAEGALVGIRTDANDRIGAGHMMRCITIGKQLIRKGCRVLFFTADTYGHSMLEGAGLSSLCLHNSWEQIQEETEQLKRQLQQTGCKILLVDSYQATREYFNKLRDCCRLVCIDDCFEDIYPVDMVINYNAYHTRFPYRKSYKESTRLLLGTAYVPLREEFQLAKREGEKAETAWREGRISVLLSSGGGDVCHALLGILQEVHLPQVVFHVVVGRFNQDREKLEQLAQQEVHIQLHENVSHMAELMSQCQLAVSAAGTVLFELCAMEIPTVFFVCADNQQYDSEFFAQHDRMLFAGDIRTDRKGCLERIGLQLKTLLEEKDLRVKMRTRLQQVTDGQGAARIAEEVCGLL
ncbi:MAG: UDP-2,4-diacetamido-2,4,6-trideoxy-beta-L-altropyranose hydrolase [Lachnospiraceae bacterium]|nr:UDP-2,4-diacetamido-2,4,6-trideoxy-beta-L-altropyranose hydrolase [Lachnospiraceae bacterium]